MLLISFVSLNLYMVLNVEEIQPYSEYFQHQLSIRFCIADVASIDFSNL